MKIVRVILAIVAFIGASVMLPWASHAFYRIAFVLMGVSFTWLFLISSAVGVFVFVKVKA